MGGLNGQNVELTSAGTQPDSHYFPYISDQHHANLVYLLYGKIIMREYYITAMPNNTDIGSN